MASSIQAEASSVVIPVPVTLSVVTVAGIVPSDVRLAQPETSSVVSEVRADTSSEVRPQYVSVRLLSDVLLVPAESLTLVRFVAPVRLKL